MTLKTTIATAIASLALIPTLATASVVSLESVEGTWTATTPAAPAVSGVGTNEIRWGNPVWGQNYQSGYRFDGANNLPKNIAPGDEINFGKFTHFNYPIYSPFLEKATLKVEVDLKIDGMLFEDIEFNYAFMHTETPNNSSHPDDIVMFNNPTMSEAFIKNGRAYLLTLSGFEVDGDLVTEFDTKEKKKNIAKLVGTLQVRDMAVPEPSTYVLLGSTLVAVPLMRRKRANSAA